MVATNYTERKKKKIDVQVTMHFSGVIFRIVCGTPHHTDWGMPLIAASQAPHLRRYFKGAYSVFKEHGTQVVWKGKYFYNVTVNKKSQRFPFHQEV